MKLVTVHGGHNNNGIGARGLEFKEEILTDELAKKVAGLCTGCVYIPQDNGDVQENLNYLVYEMNKLNRGQGANLSIHFNAFNGEATGVECFSYNEPIGIEIARNMSLKISQTLGLFNRGAKMTGLYVINNSIAVTNLVEICFIDNRKDMDSYNAKKDLVAHAIASCYDNYKGGHTTPATPPPAQKPTPAPKPQPTQSGKWVRSYNETGTMTATERNWVKDSPTKSAPIVEYQQVGQEIYYHTVLWNDGLVWLQFTSWDGKQRYVAYADATSGNGFGRKYGYCK